MLELIHLHKSTACQKIRLSLVEKNIEWKSKLMEISDAKYQVSPEYLKLNPRGLIPTIVHNGKPLGESQVILEYIEDVWPEPSLRPEDPYERAVMRTWTKLPDEYLHWDSRTIGNCIFYGNRLQENTPEQLKDYYDKMPQERRRKDDQENFNGIKSKLLPEAIWRFRRVFEKMDRTLGEGGPWLAGSSYSLADITHFVYVMRLEGFAMAPLWQHLENFCAWYQRNKDQDNYHAAVGDWLEPEGDAQRMKNGEEFFPRLQEMWDSSPLGPAT